MDRPPTVVETAIRLADLLDWVGSPERGGTAAFVGTVRRSEHDGSVESIEYSAYEEMVQAEAGRIIDEAEARWENCRVHVQHRLGRVRLGEPSIAVVAATPHRAAAFEACRFVIEEAKKRLPVWKKERFTDGRESWREDARVPDREVPGA